MDFWFNDLDLLSSEIAATNNGIGIPMELRDIEFWRAATWQYYEHDAVIIVGASDEQAVPLKVYSVNEDGKYQSSRFGISMFEHGQDIINVELPRLKSLENETQPLLDLLFAHHHDFRRLSDFSDSFALLRWLKEHGVQTTLLDLDGQSLAIATPDLIQIGEGPAIRQ